jgi:hypothetical protein
VTARHLIPLGSGEFGVWREAVGVTEMLPGPGQPWLRYAAGRRYTSEFRLVCVDARRYVPEADRHGEGD